MNKEQQELLDEAYENYSNKLLFNEKDCHVDYLINQPNKTFIPYSQERFINKCKTDTEFSQRWGLKIEERELSLEERSIIAKSNHYEVSQNIKTFVCVDEDRTLHEDMDKHNIPTKLITIKYNDKTIEMFLP
jgi:hypothetical protein